MALNAVLGALAALGGAPSGAARRRAHEPPRSRSCARQRAARGAASWACGLHARAHDRGGHGLAARLCGSACGLGACAPDGSAWRGGRLRAGARAGHAGTAAIPAACAHLRPISRWRQRPPAATHAAGIVAASLAALLVCAPWTARNCVRMKQCALVSVNGGWNLLIGADPASTGAWSPIKVPEACREVFDEAKKDAVLRPRGAPLHSGPSSGVALTGAAASSRATFDYAGAAPWYLHEANPAAFPYASKVRLGALETVFERLMLLMALAWAARSASPAQGRVRWVQAATAAVGAGAVSRCTPGGVSGARRDSDAARSGTGAGACAGGRDGGGGGVHHGDARGVLRLRPVFARGLSAADRARTTGVGAPPQPGHERGERRLGGASRGLRSRSASSQRITRPARHLPPLPLRSAGPPCCRSLWSRLGL